MARLNKGRTYLIRAGILSASFLSFIPLVGLVRQDADGTAEANTEPVTIATVTPTGRPTRTTTPSSPSTTLPQTQVQPSTPQTQPTTTPSNRQPTHTRSRGS